MGFGNGRGDLPIDGNTSLLQLGYGVNRTDWTGNAAAAVTGELVAAESVWVESHDAVIAACIVGDGRSVLMGICASPPRAMSAGAGPSFAALSTHASPFTARSPPRRAVAELASSQLSGAMLGRQPTSARYVRIDTARARVQSWRDPARQYASRPCVSWDVSTQPSQSMSRRTVMCLRSCRRSIRTETQLHLLLLIAVDAVQLALIRAKAVWPQWESPATIAATVCRPSMTLACQPTQLACRQKGVKLSANSLPAVCNGWGMLPSNARA